MYMPTSDTYSFHWNLIGDMGTHYIASGTVDLDTWEIVFDKTICLGE